MDNLKTPMLGIEKFNLNRRMVIVSDDKLHPSTSLNYPSKILTP